MGRRSGDAEGHGTRLKAEQYVDALDAVAKLALQPFERLGVRHLAAFMQRSERFEAGGSCSCGARRAGVIDALLGSGRVALLCVAAAVGAIAVLLRRSGSRSAPSV